MLRNILAKGHLLFPSLGLITPVALVWVKKSFSLFFFPPSFLSTISYRVCRLGLDFSSRNKFNKVPFQEPQSSCQLIPSPESSRTESIVLGCSSSKTDRGCSGHSGHPSGDNSDIIPTPVGIIAVPRLIMGHSSLLKHLLRTAHHSATAHLCSRILDSWESSVHRRCDPLSNVTKSEYMCRVYIDLSPHKQKAMFLCKGGF